MSKQEGTKEPAAKAEKAAPEVGEMKKGDYMVHIYLQEGKQFKLEDSDTSSPMIQISIGSKTKYSECKKDVSKISTVYWGEHIFFELMNMSKNEIESSQISLRVLNKGLLKDDLIGKNILQSLILGTYELDVTFVYFQDKHTMFNSWIALSNPEGKDFNEITCYLKLGISVTGPGDDQVALNDETGVQGEDQEVMMPPSIKKEYKQLKLRFVKGERFPKMDFNGTIDAFIQAMFMKKKLATEPVTQTKNTHETFIEQEFWLPIQWPLSSDRFVLKVYDKDPLSNEIVGSMFFSLKNLINQAGNTGLLKWYNLYGAPLGCMGENTDKMNNYPEFASTWKGRMLMHVSCFDTKNPEMKVEKLDQEFKNQIIKQGAFEYHDWELIAEIGGGISLPKKTKYTVRIQINEFTVETKKAIEQKGNYNRWSERINVTAFKGPYKSYEELGRVYVYLMDGDEPVCFWKGQAIEFDDPSPKYKWLPLQVDQAKGKVQNTWEAGLLQVKLCIYHKTKNGPIDFAKQEAWRKPPPKRLSSWKIRCFLFQCKDIPSADSDGASDPYITIWNPDDKKLQTQIIEDNINPIFFEALELYYDFDTIANAPPVVLNIWDHDEGVMDSDDYLGRAVIYLTNASISNDDSIPEPKWHDIRIGFNEGEPACGQMLCSFSVVEDDYVYKIPITYLKLTEEIEYKEYNCEINVLGLRNVESFGLMPVKKPFVRFNLRSLLPPEKAQAVTNIKTQPSATGSNPNINTVITFTIDLPVNPLFCPKLQCDCFDYVYKGLVQPLLGTFSISIGEIMHGIKNERDQQILESEIIIDDLKKMVNELQKSSNIFNIEGLEGDPTAANRRFGLFNMLADQMEQDTSALVTEGSARQEKQQLLGEGPNVQKDEESMEFSQRSDEDKKDDDKKQEEEKQQKEEEEKKSEERKSEQLSQKDSGTTSPSQSSSSQTRTIASAKKRRGLAGQSLFKKTDIKANLGIAVNIKLQIEKEQQKAELKQKMKEEREADKKKLKEQGFEPNKNILYPKYEFDDRIKMKREVKPKPPNSIFYELGFDTNPPDNVEEGNKHYRRFYDDELENVEEIFPKKAFHTVNIIRGQSRGLSKGFFSWGFLSKKTDESGEATNQKVVGQFKGRLIVENIEERNYYLTTKETRTKIILKYLDDLHKHKFDKSLDFKLSDLESFEKTQKFRQLLENLGCEDMNILSFLKEQSYQEMISRMLLVKTKCICRLYMIEGYEFAQKDIGSFSDPYLKIKCGAKKFNERDNYQLDEPNPKFHKMYEFDAEFPGAPPLVIKAYDFDDLFGDDLIGKTVIDLDDRYFSPEWQQIEEKPVEYRSLFHPSSQIPQGTVTCWLEIHNSTVSTKATEKKWVIDPQPILDYEFRLCVYDTKDVPAADAEGTSDVFIKAWIDDKEKKETDCHYRCQNGKASFNYRLVYTVKAPRKQNNLMLQVWDRDLFKSNDFISEAQFPVQHILEDAVATQKPIALNKKYWEGYLKNQWANKYDRLELKFHDDDSFFITTTGTDGKPSGKIRIRIDIYPIEMAKANPVGGGRTEPNQSPFLPPPVGRISFSLNPFTMLNQLIGPELRRKVYCYCCMALCCAVCAMMFPLILSNVASSMIMSIF